MVAKAAFVLDKCSKDLSLLWKALPKVKTNGKTTATEIKVKSKLNSLKYTNQEVKDISLLIQLSRPAEVIKDLPSYKKLQDNSKLTTTQIKQWANINSNKYIIVT